MMVRVSDSGLFDMCLKTPKTLTVCNPHVERNGLHELFGLFFGRVHKTGAKRKRQSKGPLRKPIMPTDHNTKLVVQECTCKHPERWTVSNRLM